MPVEKTAHTLDTAADEITRARLAGERAAAAFDESLRTAERREREDRLTRIAWQGGDVIEPLHGGAKSAQVVRLERQLEHFTAFHHAVLHSRGWRALQALRRLVGRAW